MSSSFDGGIKTSLRCYHGVGSYLFAFDS